MLIGEVSKETKIYQHVICHTIVNDQSRFEAPWLSTILQHFISVDHKYRYLKELKLTVDIELQNDVPFSTNYQQFYTGHIWKIFEKNIIKLSE